MSADVVEVIYDLTEDITSHVLFERSHFTSLMAAAPGSFEITLKDEANELDFTTGHEIQLKLNGLSVFGGYIWQVTKTYAFSADDTSGDFRNRLWVLSGSDYNIILDKRVLRNPAHYTLAIYSPGRTSSSIAVVAPITDGELIRDHLRFFHDLSGFDTEDVALIIDNYTWEKGFVWPTQGTRLRQTMQIIAAGDATEDTPMSTFWVDADKKFHFIQEDALAVDWGFSDVPGGSMYGFREGNGSENASSIVNDALVWGGSEWARHGDIVFAREIDGASIALHNRWQMGDVGVGNFEYNSQAQVDERARTHIFGPPGTLSGANMGLTLPEQTFVATWFNTRVPDLLYPGQVVPIQLTMFGDGPVELPLRSLDISWPELRQDGAGWTKFTGHFGLLMSDPSWLWKYLQRVRPGKIIKQVVATAKKDTSKPPYMARYQDEPATQTVEGEDLVVHLDLPNGTKTEFHIPFMYVGNTMTVFINGLAQYRGIDYVETDPATGVFTFFDAPDAGDKLWVIATVAGVIGGGACECC